MNYKNKRHQDQEWIEANEESLSNGCGELVAAIVIIISIILIIVEIVKQQ